MAKIVTVTRTYADIERGDVTAVFDDHEDEGADVRTLDLFRIVRAPGPKAAYVHLVSLAHVREGAPPPKKYFTRGVNLDALETSEVARRKRPLTAADECVVGLKATLDAVEVVKAVEVDEIVLPPVAEGKP